MSDRAEFSSSLQVLIVISVCSYVLYIIGDSGRPAPGASDGQSSPGLDCACTSPRATTLQEHRPATLIAGG